MADVTQGRGAFTRIGKDNKQALYTYIPNTPRDGSSPEKDDNYRAVSLGIRAYQMRLNEMGAPAALGIPPFVDGSGVGNYGPKTKKCVAWAQIQLKTGLTSGVIGSTFSRAIWKETCRKAASAQKCPPELLYGIMLQESGGDAGAVGYTTPDDSGLFQINMNVHGAGTPENFTVEQVYDPNFAGRYVAKRLTNALNRYDEKGDALRLDCAIAQHNAPAWADTWYRTGTAPNATIASYVAKIKAYAKQY
jgi:hypothetical protein